jgi:hypothetical protein
MICDYCRKRIPDKQPFFWIDDRTIACSYCYDNDLVTDEDLNDSKFCDEKNHE